MPHKSVREMSNAERAHYSLAARTFHAILAISFIICIAAITFGFFMYQSAIRDRYMDETYNLAKTAASVLDEESVVEICGKVVDRWRALPDEQKADPDAPAYQALFADVMDESYEQMRDILGWLQEENGASSVYLAVNDKQSNAFLYIVDSDRSEMWCPPGYWEEMTPSIAEHYIDDPVETPFFVSRTAYGYLGTSYDYIRSMDGYTILVCADVPMNEVQQNARSFLLQFAIAMLIVTVTVAVIAVQHTKKTMVAPIAALTEAAQSYISDKKNLAERHDHFQKLGIRTGDEVENLSLVMADMENDLALYIENLTRVTAEKERIGAELDIASQIQNGMLPDIYPAFPDRPEFDIYATMTAAKEVGGDFYDFFLIDDDHLAIVMADVSGKGVPAALFMMASKILINNFSTIEKMSPARILERMNNAICKNNPAEMFVTVWLGILQISTGRLKAANAGHEYPAVKKADGSYELYRDKHGFVVGGMTGVRYQDYELTLHSGDALFLYTDGVPEATDAKNEMFGTDRMLEALNRHPDAKPDEVLAAVHGAVNDFVKQAPQFDDLTMLCLEMM